MKRCKRCGNTNQFTTNGNKPNGGKRWKCGHCSSEAVEDIKPDSSTPHWDDFVEVSTKNGNALFIGDTHEPFTKSGYMNFCLETAHKYDCQTFFHIGDVVDFNAMSFHEKDPDGITPGLEIEMIEERLQPWFESFPELYICIGNHDALPARQAKAAGITKRFMKSINEVIGAPDGWVWANKYWVDNSYIAQHGTGKSGQNMHVAWAKENMESTVTGHGHSVHGTTSFATPTRRIWALGTGCGIDRKAFSMQYGKDFSRKPFIGCAVVTGYGHQPIPVAMNCNNFLQEL